MKNIDKSPYMRRGSLKPPNLNSKDQIIAILEFYITANYCCIKQRNHIEIVGKNEFQFFSNSYLTGAVEWVGLGKPSVLSKIIGGQ